MRLLHFLFCIVLCFFFIFSSHASNFRSVQTGDWNDASTWNKFAGAGGTAGVDFPSPTDNVFISDGDTVYIDFGTTGTLYEYEGTMEVEVGGLLWVEVGTNTSGLALINNARLFNSGQVYAARNNEGPGTVGPTEIDIYLEDNSIYYSFSNSFNYCSDDVHIRDNAIFFVEIDVCIEIDDDFHLQGTNSRLCGEGGASIGVSTADNDVIFETGASAANICNGLTVFRGVGATCNPNTGTAIVTGTGPTNLSPIAVDDLIKVDQNTATNIDVLNLGLDDIDVDGDTIKLISAGINATINNNLTEAGGSLSINTNGTASVFEDDFILYSPPTNFVGTDMFQYIIEDNIGATDTAVVSVNVACGSGNKTTYVASYPLTTFDNSGVGSSNALANSPNNNYAEWHNNGDILSLDFQAIYPKGTRYVMRWRRRSGESGNAIPIIEESQDNNNYTTRLSVPSRSNNTVTNDTLIAENSFRYLRISKNTPPSVTDFQIDAIGILSATCESDIDGDGIADDVDEDADNDGISNLAEELVDSLTSVGVGQYTVPFDAEVNIQLRGGDGGSSTVSNVSGTGATIIASFLLKKNDLIQYVVGERGSIGFSKFGGGSSGLFINDTLEMVAGAGGAANGFCIGKGAIATPTGSLTGSLGDGGNGLGGSPEGGAGGGINSNGFNGGAGFVGLSADLNPTDGLTIVGNGSGRGFTSGGAAFDSEEAGGGGGYSGGNVAEGCSTGGGGSFLNDTSVSFISGSITAGVDGGATTPIDGFLYIYLSGDIDGDGITDRFDLDSDNDGINDLKESGGVDNNNDGKPDDLTDSNNNGWADIYESDNGGTDLALIDSDGDSIPDFLDRDSDNDGISDLVENGNPDSDRDGIVDNFIDADGDGWAAAFDSDEGADFFEDLNSDNDAFSNRIDIDSDNDGVVDIIESQVSGVLNNFSGVDAFGDGIDDAFEQAGIPQFTIPIDSDLDGIPDYIDSNSDNDNDSDFLEAYDTNNDGIVQNVTLSDPPVDADGDGLSDEFDLVNGKEMLSNISNSNQSSSFFPNFDYSNTPERDWREFGSEEDVDGDGLENSNDDDDDNDGLTDLEEACPNFENRLNWDNNPVSDPWTLPNTVVTGVETVNSGTLDVFVDGNLEGNLNLGDTRRIVFDLTSTFTSGDLYFEFDAIVDSVTFTIIDIDADERTSINATNRYIDKVVVVGVLRDGSSVTQVIPTLVGSARNTITGNTAIGTSRAGNNNASGNVYVSFSEAINEIYIQFSCDVSSTAASGNPAEQNFAISDIELINREACLDTDGDGFINSRDLDSDGDAISDIIESGGVDIDGDGRIDISSDLNSSDSKRIKLNKSATVTNTDFDGDGIANHIDIDSDNDGVLDIIEAQNSVDFVNPSGTDTDNDGLDDQFDLSQGNSFTLNDNDGDDSFDFLDNDSDEDGNLDIVEANDENVSGDALDDFVLKANAFIPLGGIPTPYVNSLDDDSDGIPNWLDDANMNGKPDFVDFGSAFYLDADGDGLVDLFDVDQNGSLPVIPDTDMDGEPDFRDSDDGVTLPIELVSFSGYQLRNYIQLEWITSSEINNDYFNIERLNKEGIFEPILTRAGAGNSSVSTTYNDLDLYPNRGFNYYRLVQTDYDGTTKKFEPIQVSFEGVFISRIIPNPNNGYQLTYISELQLVGKVEVSIYSFNGELKYNQFFNLKDPINQLQIQPNDQLSKGVYLLKIASVEKEEVLKFIVH